MFEFEIVVCAQVLHKMCCVWCVLVAFNIAEIDFHSSDFIQAEFKMFKFFGNNLFAKIFDIP